MKKITSIIAVALLLVFQSCKKSDHQEIAAPATTTTENNNNNIAELKEAVANSFGIEASHVVYDAEAKEFVVEEDSYVSLQDAQMRFSNKGGVASGVNGTNQMAHFYLVAPTKVSTIKLYADATVPAMWIAAIDKAIANWNSTGSSVRIQRINTATGATTKVTTNYSVSKTIATAGYPDYYGNAGNRMTINTYKNALAASMKVFAITHELGHIIGFSHTNSTAGELIEGTPVVDAKSVMNSVCLNWAGFTTNDVKAVTTVYPR